MISPWELKILKAAGKGTGHCGLLSEAVLTTNLLNE